MKEVEVKSLINLLYKVKSFYIQEYQDGNGDPCDPKFSTQCLVMLVGHPEIVGVRIKKVNKKLHVTREFPRSGRIVHPKCGEDLFY